MPCRLLYVAVVGVELVPFLPRILSMLKNPSQSAYLCLCVLDIFFVVSEWWSLLVNFVSHLWPVLCSTGERGATITPLDGSIFRSVGDSV